MSLRFAQKRIFVTGGSRGIGAGIVRNLAHQGAQVAFTYSSREESALQLLKSLPGEGHFCIQMDVSKVESINAGCLQILERWISIDGVVNNAGITKDQLLLRMKLEDFDDVINTNLRGTFLVTKSFLKPMLKAQKGSIVNITSIIGLTGNNGQTIYAASKAGIEAFSKSLAQEVGSRGIRVNCVAPGFIATEMTDALNTDQKNQILTKIPLQSLGNSDDVAHAVSYLLSDESRYVTGHTLSVNGGMFMN